MVVLEKEKKIGYGYILKDRNFCLYMFGNLVSRFGDSIDSIAYGWMVYQLIGGAIYLKIAESVKGITLFVWSGVTLGIGYTSLAFMSLIGEDMILYGMLITIGLLMGVGVSIMMMRLNITFMTKIEQQYLGRTAGLVNSLASAATPLGAGVVGSLCLFLTTQQIFLIFGILMVVLFFIQRYNKNMQEV